jgi:hypothetical protein
LSSENKRRQWKRADLIIVVQITAICAVAIAFAVLSIAWSLVPAHAAQLIGVIEDA